MMKSIVDVVCHSTSEVLKEGVSLEAARAFIAEKEGKVVKDEIVQLFFGEERTLWVEIPEVVAELKKQAGAAKRSREFWNPMRES
tara:strand:- start:76 stop:330 length:255 start_codon:yes stop_codon:yes gene_type:complete